MGKKLPIYIFYIILAVILVIAVSVVVYSYNKDKVVVPDNNITYELTDKNMESIKEQYNSETKKQEFITCYKDIELKVANKLLDGSVTKETELKEEITKINKMFKSNDWSYIGYKTTNYWMGTWMLDDTGKLSFTFKYEKIKPDWATSLKEYIK